MGLPTRNVEFQNERDKPATYVSWENILYKPELFPPVDHSHPNIDKEKFYHLLFTNGYSLASGVIDDDETLPIVSLKRVPASNVNNEFTILEIEAPEKLAKESTLTLMRRGDSVGGAEFIDFTDMNYGERKCCIVVQKRGGGANLAPFDITFNDGSGRKDVLKVHPDGKLTQITNDGIVTKGALTFEGTLQSTALEHPQILYAGYGEMYMGNPETQMYIETSNDLKVYSNGKTETAITTGNLNTISQIVDSVPEERKQGQMFFVRKQ